MCLALSLSTFDGNGYFAAVAVAKKGDKNCKQSNTCRASSSTKKLGKLVKKESASKVFFPQRTSYTQLMTSRIKRKLKAKNTNQKLSTKNKAQSFRG